MVWGALGGARPGLGVNQDGGHEGGVSQNQAPAGPRSRCPSGPGLEFSLPEHQESLPLLCDFLPSTRQCADGTASRWVQVCP